MSFINTEVDNESTFRGGLSLIFGGDDSHLSQSSCAGDESVSGRSGRVVRFPRCATRVSDEGTGHVRDRSLLSDATAVCPLNEERERGTVTVCTGRNTEQSVLTPIATAQSSCSNIVREVPALTECNMEQSATRLVQSSRRPSVTTRETTTPPSCASENTPISSTLTNRLLREEQAIRLAQLNTSAQQRAELHAIEVQEAKLRVKEIEERIRARARLDELRALILEEQLQQSRMATSQQRSGGDKPPC